jgi:hypothetical protein
MLGSRAGVLLGTAVLFLAVAPAIGHEEAAGGRDAVIELDILPNGDLPVVNVGTLGKTLCFLVDTTSSRTVYDRKWRTLFGRPLRTTTVRDADGGKAQMELFRGPELHIGASLLAPEMIAIHDCSCFNDGGGYQIDGCLGLDVLKQFVVVIDCDRATIQLRKSLPRDCGQETSFAIDSRGLPVVNLAIGNTPALPFIISTTTTSALHLTPSLFLELRKRAEIRSSNPTVSAAELQTQGSTGIVKRIALGPLVHNDIGVETGHFNALGMGYLSRCIVTLDFPRQRAYLQRGNGFGRADQLDGSGLNIVRRGGAIVVDTVLPNSPANDAGILEGDVVRQIEQRTTAEMSLFEVRRTLQQSGITVSVAAERDDNLLTFKLALRDYHDVYEQTVRGPARDERRGGSDSVAEFDIARHGEAIIVPVTVDGIARPLRMLMDSGSTRTVVDKRLSVHLGKTIRREEMNTPFGPRIGELRRLPQAGLGPVQLSRASICVTDDLQHIREGFGCDIDGIIGMDLLRRQILQIDFDNGRVRLLKSATGDLGHREEIVYRPSGTPAIEASLSGFKPSWFMVDTGCTSWSMCEQDVIRPLIDAGAAYEPHPSRVRDDSWMIMETCRIRSISIGPFTHRNVKVATSHVNALGLPYLSRYVVTLDFPGKAVYLKEGQRYGEADRDDMSGIWLVDRGGRKVVVDVFPGSPAQEAGIRTGDAILGIDGHNADNMSLFELRDLLKREATSIAAVISRKGRAIELTVRLRDYSADGGR